MSTTSIKYQEPSSGVEIAFESFTEDGETRLFERMVTGYKPNTLATIQAGSMGNDGSLDIAPCASLVISGENYWAASSGDSGAYYCTDFDFDSMLILGVEVNGSMITAGTAGALSNDEYAVTDQDSIGDNALYIQLAVGDPDGQAEDYVKLHYALSCAGASVIRVASYFSVASETAVVHPILFQIENGLFPQVLASESIAESGLDFPNGGNMLNKPGTGFDIDVKGAQYYALGIKTPPATGTVTFLGLAA